MSSRPLEQLRETLDSIVEDLCNREQAVDKEQAHLVERLNELDQRQTQLKSLEEMITSHQATESQLAERMQSLISALEKRATAPPEWMSSAIDTLERRVEKLLAQQATPAPVEELVRELDRTTSRSLNALVEQITTSLQTAIAVQLAPLSDDLPERLAAAVSTAATSQPAPLPVEMPELARELEKLESRSLAAMAARMSAGLQTALANQWSSLTADLPQQIADVLEQSPALKSLIATTPASNTAPASNGSSTGSSPASDAASGAHIADLKQKLARAQSELSETKSLLREALEHSSKSTSSSASSVAAANEQVEQLIKNKEVDDQLIEALRTEISDLRSLLTAKEHDSVMVDELRSELAELREQLSSQEDPATAMIHASGPEFDDLREKLELATCEIIDLRSQNEELAQRVTRMQVSTAPHGPMPHLGQEGLSWEERKKLLLQQLDAEQETGAATPQQSAKRIEIEDVIKSTDAELARRDREINELRSLLEQQADARQGMAGMAVGAAAVAQLIESDELVQQEREKLRGLQLNWDEKFRQAEIDLSMERAKLARERLQLEEQKQELQAALHAAQSELSDAKDKSADLKGRKWLSRLGLKDEK